MSSLDGPPPGPPSDPPSSPPETTSEVALRSRRGFDGKLLHVRVDDVRLPSGRETVREVVEHPGAVAVVPLTAAGQLLLVRQYRHAAGASLLEIPAGTREPGESAAETARRELAEEVGHAPGRLTELATFFSSAGYSDEQLILFRADDCAPVPHAPFPDEGITIVPVSLADIPALLADPARPVRDAKTLVGLLWLLRGDAPPLAPVR